MIKTLRTNNGLEFVNKDFDSFFKEHVIFRHKTVARTPQQNDLVERMNKTIIEKVRCILSYSSLSKTFWVNVVKTTSHLINR